jgi:hypothetical protein
MPCPTCAIAFDIGHVFMARCNREVQPLDPKAFHRQTVANCHRHSGSAMPAITPAAFEAQLRADGFIEIETKTYQPAPANGQHGHHFDVRGLVLEGAFSVGHQAGTATNTITYRPGDVFFVANGDLHDEQIGSDGARVLLGRRY